MEECALRWLQHKSPGRPHHLASRIGVAEARPPNPAPALSRLPAQVSTPLQLDNSHWGMCCWLPTHWQCETRTARLRARHMPAS